MKTSEPGYRSWIMSRIKGKNTKIEVLVRSRLFEEGFRFRKNDKRYPGKPDVVLPKYKTIIFVNGCFWHQHEGCRNSHIPESNTEYWKPKLSQNVINDQKHIQELKEMGWNVITIWECELKKDLFESTMERVIKEIRDNSMID